MFKQWKGVIDILKRYWRGYGGISAFIGSPYLQLSILLTIITVGYWNDNEWWNQTLSILPNILGFTLGGFAIFLSLGSEDFRKFISLPNNNETADETPYMQLVASYVHFVLMQLCAIFLALIANAASNTSLPIFISENINYWMRYIISGIGYFIFLYSIVLAISVCFGIYRLNSLFTKYNIIQHEKNNEQGRNNL